MKYSDHNIFGMNMSAAIISVSVELLVFNFFPQVACHRFFF